ncbi:MAG TPA: hypothetical protein VIU11_06295 [Nakamurella sp.]
MPRAARMRFAVVSHTIFLFVEYHSYAANLSRDQFEIAYPIRSLYESGLPAALGSDGPATSWADADDVFTSIGAAVNRRAHTGADIGQADHRRPGTAARHRPGRCRRPAVRVGPDRTRLVLQG